MKQWMIASALALAAMAAGPVNAFAQQDAWITMKTKIALMTADNVSTSDLNVDTVSGAVTLHGTVETAAEKTNAETVAKGIVPASTEKRTEVNDKDIEDRVKNAFKADMALKDSGISVTSVNKGVVLLSGRAKTIDAHLKAIETAKGVAGVRRVATQVTMAESR